MKKTDTAGELPLAYMLRVMRDQRVNTRRRDAMALAGAAFCHPKLEAINQSGTLDLSILTDEHLELLRRLYARQQDHPN
jgi:hypothetical protein